MDSLFELVKREFGCAKSKIKLHSFHYMQVADNRYSVRELCVKCHQPRD
jgi:hypothetical protein